MVRCKLEGCAQACRYYNTEGVADHIVIEVPKGSYAVAFHERAAAAAMHGNGSTAASWANDRVESASSAAQRRYLVPGLSLALVAALAVIRMADVDAPGFWDFVCKRGSGKSGAYADSNVLERSDHRPEEPWVVFSNAAFVGRPNTGMRYYDAAKDAKLPILDHYTGVGEVLAVHNLDIVFGELHQALRVKREEFQKACCSKTNRPSAYSLTQPSEIIRHAYWKSARRSYSWSSSES